MSGMGCGFESVLVLYCWSASECHCCCDGGVEIVSESVKESAWGRRLGRHPAEGEVSSSGRATRCGGGETTWRRRWCVAATRLSTRTREE